MRAPRRPELAVLVLLVTAVAAGVWFAHGLSSERREAQARWGERGPTSYSYSYFYCGGMCANCPVRVTVHDGVVASATVENPQCDDPDPADVLTIADLFAIAAEHQPGPFSNNTSISYDDHWGFPTFIRFTCDEGVSDCGGGWSVADFEVLS